MPLSVTFTYEYTLGSTQLFSSHTNAYHGDTVTLLCTYDDLNMKLSNGRALFDMSSVNPLWWESGQVITNNSYYTLLHSPYASSIKVTVNKSSANQDIVNYSCGVVLITGWIEESYSVKITRLVDDILPGMYTNSMCTNVLYILCILYASIDLCIYVCI